MYYLEFAKIGLFRVTKKRIIIDSMWTLNDLIKEIKNSNGKYVYIGSGVNVV